MCPILNKQKKESEVEKINKSFYLGETILAKGAVRKQHLDMTLMTPKHTHTKWKNSPLAKHFFKGSQKQQKREL